MGSVEGERGELLKNNLASRFGFEVNVLLHVAKEVPPTFRLIISF